MRTKTLLGLMICWLPVGAFAQALPVYEIIPYNKMYMPGPNDTLDFRAFKIDRKLGIVKSCGASFKKNPDRVEARCSKYAEMSALTDVKTSQFRVTQTEINPANGATVLAFDLWAIDVNTGAVSVCIVPRACAKVLEN